MQGLYACLSQSFFRIAPHGIVRADNIFRMADSPTKRTKAIAAQRHFVAADCESKRGRFTYDAFGWGDLLLLAGPECDESPTLIMVQVTSASNRSSRRSRMLQRDVVNVRLWLADGTRGAALITTGHRGGAWTRWTTMSLDEDGAIVETDEWIEDGKRRA